MKRFARAPEDSSYHPFIQVWDSPIWLLLATLAFFFLTRNNILLKPGKRIQEVDRLFLATLTLKVIQTVFGENWSYGWSPAQKTTQKLTLPCHRILVEKTESWLIAVEMSYQKILVNPPRTSLKSQPFSWKPYTSLTTAWHKDSPNGNPQSQFPRKETLCYKIPNYETSFLPAFAHIPPRLAILHALSNSLP